MINLPEQFRIVAEALRRQTQRECCERCDSMLAALAALEAIAGEQQCDCGIKFRRPYHLRACSHRLCLAAVRERGKDGE